MVSESVLNMIKAARRIVIFSGAGMSAESGIPTFRDDLVGLWRHYDPMQLATAEAFAQDPELVWGWYEWRRARLAQAQPNAGHLAIAQWQKHYPLTIITQNVDDLHERAQSYSIIHMHGSLNGAYCSQCKHPHPLVALPVNLPPEGAKISPPLCELCQGLVRPGVVWFGEPLIDADLRKAIYAAEDSDLVLAVGTSGVVQPAALVPYWAKEKGALIIQINPNATVLDEISDVNVRQSAAKALPYIVHSLGYN